MFVCSVCCWCQWEGLEYLPRIKNHCTLRNKCPCLFFIRVLSAPPEYGSQLRLLSCLVRHAATAPIMPLPTGSSLAWLGVGSSEHTGHRSPKLNPSEWDIATDLQFLDAYFSLLMRCKSVKMERPEATFKIPRILWMKKLKLGTVKCSAQNPNC